MDHYRLVSRMAQVTGTDVVAAAEAGDLSQKRWAGIVQTCRRCQWSGRCQEWLDGHDNVEKAPSTCLNRHQFEVLKEKARVRATEES